MDGVRDATRRAFEAWSNVTCNGKRTSLRFEEGTDIPGTRPLADHGPGEDLVRHLLPRRRLAVRRRQRVARAHEPDVRQDERLDRLLGDRGEHDGAASSRLSDTEPGIDLQAVLTHEVGHYIGLAHSQVEDSIMAPSYCQSPDRCGTSTDQARALAEDDIDAVCASIRRAESRACRTRTRARRRAR